MTHLLDTHAWIQRALGEPLPPLDRERAQPRRVYPSSESHAWGCRGPVRMASFYPQ